jgi:hypothetical protein
MPKRRFLLVTCVCLTLISLVSGIWVFQSREPQYQGTSLTALLEDLRNPDLEIEKNAETGIRTLGTNAIPTLLKLMSAEDSSFKLKLIKWTGRQSWVRVDFPLAASQHSLAADGFEVLGPGAKSAIPALAEIAKKNRDGFVGKAFLHIGTEGLDVLAQVLTNSDLEVRTKAVDGLIQYGVFYDPAQNDLPPQELAAFPEKSRVAVIPLINSLFETNQLFRAKAILALGWFRSEPSLVVPVLITNLQSASSSRMVRSSSLIALSQFKGDAREAIPVITNSLFSSDSTIRSRATNALIRIDPEAAIKLGIKESESSQ